MFTSAGVCSQGVDAKVMAKGAGFMTFVNIYMYMYTTMAAMYSGKEEQYFTDTQSQ